MTRTKMPHLGADSLEARRIIAGAMRSMADEIEGEDWQPTPVMGRIGTGIETLERLLDEAGNSGDFPYPEDLQKAKMYLDEIKSGLWGYLIPYISDFRLDEEGHDYIPVKAAE